MALKRLYEYSKPEPGLLLMKTWSLYSTLDFLGCDSLFYNLKLRNPHVHAPNSTLPSV